MAKLTNTQIVDLLLSERPWNIARRAFAKHVANLTIMVEESRPGFPSKADIHKAEFEAVDEIARALGVVLSPATGHRVADGEADPAARVPDPEGLKAWLGDRPEPPGGAPREPDSGELGDRGKGLGEGPREPEGPEVPALPKRCP